MISDKGRSVSSLKWVLCEVLPTISAVKYLYKTDLYDLIFKTPRRRLDHSGIANLFADQRPSNRRTDRYLAALDIRLVGTYEYKLILFLSPCIKHFDRCSKG